MSSAGDTSLPVATDKATPDLFPSPPTLGGEGHNIVFQRMMDRVEDEDNPVPLVLACLAYYNYKIAKRKWIMDWIARNNQRPTDRDVDYFVSTWDDLSIDRAFSAAQADVRNFVVGVVEATKDDLSEEVYQNLFRDLSIQISDHTKSSETRATNILSLVRERTRSNWFLSACADITISIIANFIWFVLTVVILIGLSAQFDFGRIIDKGKMIFNNQDVPTSNDKPKQ
jgi:hypothetical protein